MNISKILAIVLIIFASFSFSSHNFISNAFAAEGSTEPGDSGDSGDDTPPPTCCPAPACPGLPGGPTVVSTSIATPIPTTTVSARGEEGDDNNDGDDDEDSGDDSGDECVSDGSCSVSCGTSTCGDKSGVDNCGNPCTVTCGECAEGSCLKCENNQCVTSCDTATYNTKCCSGTCSDSREECPTNKCEPKEECQGLYDNLPGMDASVCSNPSPRGISKIDLGGNSPFCGVPFYQTYCTVQAKIDELQKKGCPTPGMDSLGEGARCFTLSWDWDNFCGAFCKDPKKKN
jgi:hypothetical protein